MGSTKFISYLSPAKLNLGLKVTAKQEDGYHQLKTIFCLIDLFDQIEIQVLSEDKISLIEHCQAWSYKTDLSYKAAQLLKQATGCTLGANIKVKKVIPSGAGLGGGSSNAATVLVALNHLWQTNLSQSKLINLGRELGADVPFFIHGKNALATGIGDKFSDIELPEQYFVLVKPKFHIPTKDIFKNLEINFDDIYPDLFTQKYLLDTLDNDLQHVATRLFPELSTIITNLKNYGNPAMTGSGSVIYLSYNDKNLAKKVAQELGKSYNNYLVKSLSFSPIFA